MHGCYYEVNRGYGPNLNFLHTVEYCKFEVLRTRDLILKYRKKLNYREVDIRIYTPIPQNDYYT